MGKCKHACVFCGEIPSTKVSRRGLTEVQVRKIVQEELAVQEAK